MNTLNIDPIIGPKRWGVKPFSKGSPNGKLCRAAHGKLTTVSGVGTSERVPPLKISSADNSFRDGNIGDRRPRLQKPVASYQPTMQFWSI
ncbi:MAG: hypothetical protein V2B19_03365 [Pseudomonadota bacterium]